VVTNVYALILSHISNGATPNHYQAPPELLLLNSEILFSQHFHSFH